VIEAVMFWNEPNNRWLKDLGGRIEEFAEFCARMTRRYAG
jgi:hypothetical protein